MVDEHAHSAATERLSEFIYGTVTGLVALAGLEREAPAWWRSAAIILAGAVAVWLAHAYSHHLAHRVAGKALDGRKLLEGLRASWPVVSAGVLLCVPLVLVALHVCSSETALALSRGLGIATLAVFGYVANPGSVFWRLVHALLAASVGLAVVGLELAVHHLE